MSDRVPVPAAELSGVAVTVTDVPVFGAAFDAAAIGRLNVELDAVAEGEVSVWSTGVLLAPLGSPVAAMRIVPEELRRVNVTGTLTVSPCWTSCGPNGTLIE